MAVKTDGQRRYVELEFLVPGTPEQVWHAIATGPGITAWFTPTSVEERVGGAISFELGEGMTSAGVVTAWEPCSRFAYEERGWSGDAPPLASELVVVGRSGNRCVVRLVHSLFTSKDSWDDEMEGFEQGWRGFFEVLRVYLRDFAGQAAAVASAVAVHRGPHEKAWADLATELGMSGPNLGEQRTAPPRAPRLSGTVEHVRQGADGCEVMLRLEQPAAGIALVGSYPSGDKTRVAASVYFYGPRADEAARAFEPGCRAWFNERSWSYGASQT